MAEGFIRKETRFITRGLNVAEPADVLAPEFSPYLKNVFTPIIGQVSSRDGTTVVNATPVAGPIHSITRLNDYLNDRFARFLGASTFLYGDNALHDTFNQIDSGYAGDPLTFVRVRPPQAPTPWTYIGDANHQRRVSIDQNVENVGIAVPTLPTTAVISPMAYTIIDDGENVGLWTAGGTAAAPVPATRVNCTILAIVYDVGATAWATIAMTPVIPFIQNFQVGALVILNNGGGNAEQVKIDTLTGAFTSTTVQAIQYSGVTATVVLTDTSANVQLDQMVLFDSGGGNQEYARVLSVTFGPNGVPCFTCKTTLTHVAGETCEGVPSFRAYCANTHTAAETITSNVIESSLATGTATLTKLITIDLSVINGKPIDESTEIHASVLLDLPENLVEGRIIFDVNASVTDFLENYFYFSFSPDALTAAAANSITTLSAQQSIIQQQQIQGFFQGRRALDESPLDAPTTNLIPPGAPAVPGRSTWTELRFHVSDLVRIGSDRTRTLKDVAGVRIQLQVSAATTVAIDAIWIGGVDGVDDKIDVGIGAPINYRYVYYNSNVGARSNPSPAMRSGVNVHKQSITGTVTASPDPQVDQIEIYRTGGALLGDPSTGRDPWYYVMTIPATAPTFLDTYGDDVVIRNRRLDFDSFQPFLDLDVPQAGFLTVVGTEVTRVSGANFNTAWPEGTVIIINSVPYTLHAPPSSTSALSLEQNAGSQTNVPWLITAPRLMGQPMPSLFGPYTGGQFPPVMFACGSLLQPGVLFHTRPGDPDSNGQYGSIEVCDPAEKLVQGVIYRNQAYVFSTDNMYVLTPTIVGGQLTFQSQRIEGGVGLVSRTAICVGDLIYLVSKNGVYATDGGPCRTITDPMLYPIFPHEGVPAMPTNNIAPPDFTDPNSFHLIYIQGKVFFFYGRQREVGAEGTWPIPALTWTATGSVAGADAHWIMP